MNFRRVIILALLIGWVLSSPIAIAFGGCVGMGATCEGPCVLTSCALSTPTQLAAPQVVPYLPPEHTTYLPVPVVKLLKPPPESMPFFTWFSAMA